MTTLSTSWTDIGGGSGGISRDETMASGKESTGITRDKPADPSI